MPPVAPTMEIDMTKDAKQPDAAKPRPTEVSDAALDKAAGGLNPQPLPPRWGGKGN